jgi:hypothetical protein
MVVINLLIQKPETDARRVRRRRRRVGSYQTATLLIAYVPENYRPIDGILSRS